MKKWIALVCLVLIALSFVAVPVASAEDEYYLVPEGQTIEFIHNDIGGYGEQDVSRSRIVLPYGYTVQRRATVGSYVEVTYAGMTGGISIEDWSKMPNTAAPAVIELPTIEVKATNPTAFRFTSSGAFQDNFLDDGKKLLYVGNYSRNGTEYYAVRIEGENGIIYYVSSENVSNKAEVESTLHPQTTVVDTIDKSTVDASKTAKNKEFTWVRFILILGIIVPLVTIVFMVIRPRRRARHAPREIYDNDDDDYDGIDEV